MNRDYSIAQLSLGGIVFWRGEPQKKQKIPEKIGRRRGSDKIAVFGIKEKNDGRVWVGLPRAFDSQTPVGLIENKAGKKGLKS